jgi:putative ABC transport system permease protein
VNSLDDFGLTQFTLPIVPVVVICVAAAILGLVASLRPAFRAAKLDVLDAIATE